MAKLAFSGDTAKNKAAQFYSQHSSDQDFFFKVYMLAIRFLPGELSSFSCGSSKKYGGSPGANAVNFMTGKEKSRN